MTLGTGYFDGMYDDSPDPWSLASRWYEERKYALTMAALPRPRYRRAFEPGCSVGVLTALLADRCDELLSCDTSSAAVGRARRRAPGARVEQRTMPRDWPEGRFDLIVLSELLYYFDDRDLARTLALAADSLEPGGNLVAVHWRYPVPEYPQAGEQVHAALARTSLNRVVLHAETDFLCEVHVRGEPVSVASAEGLV